MSGFTAAAAVALTVAAVVVYAGVARRADSGADAVHILNGRNVEWPCAAAENVHVAGNVIGTRAQVWGDRAFVLTPRFRPGVPFTVSAVRLGCGGADRCWPALVPYPRWSTHVEGDPDAVQNAVDMHLDPTGVLWLLDSGLVNTMERPVRRARPRIFAVDVKTDEVVKRIDLSGLACPASRLGYIAADYGDDGRAFVYVSDAATRAVIVWDVAADCGYRAVLPEAVARDRTGPGDAMYVALARPSTGKNVLYLTYLTSDRMYAIDTRHLRRERQRGNVTVVGRKPDNVVLLGTDGRTTLYFRYGGRGDVYAWDTDRGGFGPDRFALVRKSDGRGRLATQVAPGHRGGVPWLLESNFPDYVSGTVGCLGADVRLQPLVEQRR